jgi:hypothetical protein
VITDPRQWRLINPRIATAYLERLSPKEGPRRVFNYGHRLPDDISPLRLYAFLRATCGPPNGFQTFLRHDSVDNLIQWDFLLEDDTFVIEFIGLNFRIECRLWAFVPFPEPDWHEFDSNLRDVLAREAEKIGKCIATFEKWQLFVNPHQRLEAVASHLENRLKELDKELTEFPTFLGSADDYARQMKSLMSKALELSTFATVLQSVAPVLGEAAVNLLIHFLARDEIRKDSRLLEDTCRRNIDVRIKRLSVDCQGFERQVDQNRDEFKNFLRLMSRRNDALHGNVDPKRSVGEPIYFDLRTIPLVERQKEFSRFAYENATAGISAAAARQDLKTARDFVEFLLIHLTPAAQHQMRVVARELHLGYCPGTGRFGIILPRAFVDLQPEFEGDKSDAKWSGDGI